MLVAQCTPGFQADTCPKTTDDALPAVLGLLPPGPAWSAANVEGTVQHHYWRSFANVLGYTYDRLCAYVDEFFCATVNESRDQWIEEYGLNDDCDPYGYNLCLKVAAEGGATCDYFVEMAALSGYAITCHDVSKDPEPIAGCYEVGCTPLGPTPVFLPIGTNIGYGQRGGCAFGEVVEHPFKDLWDASKSAQARNTCPVPGSNLGHGPDEGESCCFIVGWYEEPGVPDQGVADYCRAEDNVITFECPVAQRENDPTPGYTTNRTVGGYDDTRNYISWGLSYVWEVTVDIAASQAMIPSPPPVVGEPDTMSAAGCFMVGDTPLLPTGEIGGTPLCADVTTNPQQPNFVLCFLDRIKPAHTILNIKVLQP